MTINRDLDGANQNRIYLNKVDNTQSTQFNFDNNGNFSSNILNIGMRNATNIGFVGSLQQIRLYKRILTQAEITQLYNE